MIHEKTLSQISRDTVRYLSVVHVYTCEACKFRRKCPVWKC